MSSTKSVLITGCSDGGIGSGLAHAFADHDFRVFATARDISKMGSLSDNPNVTLLKLDVTDTDLIDHAVKTVSGETGGRLDFLVNNAGVIHYMPILDEALSDVKAVFHTNVWGGLALTKAFSPLLVAAKGTIVNISSASGYINVPWMGTYAASKRAADILAETLRMELKPFGVHVVSLVTAGVKTHVMDRFDNFQLPEDSIYKSIESTVRYRAQGKNLSPDSQLSPGAYADKVVPRLIKGNQSGIMWGPGSVTGFVKFAIAWLPTWVLDYMLIQGTGLDEIAVRS